MQRSATGDDDGQLAPTSQPGSRQSLGSESSGSPSAASINVVTALPSVRRASSPLPRQGFPTNRHFLLSSSQQSGITTTGDNTKPAGRFSDAVSSAIGRARALSSDSGGRDSAHSRQTQAQGHQSNGADSSFGIDADPFASQFGGPSYRYQNASLSSEQNSSSAHQASGASFPRKHRGSLLVAASDALGFGRVGASISKRMGKRSSLDRNASPAVHTQSRKGLPWSGKGKVKPRGHWALQPPSSSQLATDVIEISAAKTGLTAGRDGEDESERRERDRLREAAAESIGIGSLFREDASSRITESDGFRYDDESAEDNESRGLPGANADDDLAGRPNVLEWTRTSMNGGINQQDGDAGLQTRQIREKGHNRSSSVSGVIPPTTPTSTSGWPLPSIVAPFLSTTTRSQKNSVEANSTQLPPFPCLFSALDSISNKSTSLLKFVPSSHLLRLGFSRQWRTRTIVLTTPRRPTSPSFYTFRSFTPTERLPPVYHLHLFKSSGADERELERLEVNENSVVFVAEEEISGKRSVVKVGGVDVGARRRELNVEGNGQTMWLLSLFDASEAQDWITSLKSAVLDQRAAKAGLAMPTHSSSASGPKGDLDVMLSMRAQDVASTVRAQSRPVGSSNDEVRARGSESPTPTTKSWTGERRRPVSPSGRIISLKGLFSVPGRARSMSHGRNDKDSPTTPVDAPSFASRGTTLLNMIRPPTSGMAEDTKSAPSSPRVASQTLPVPIPDPGPILPKAELNLEKSSLRERDKELPPWYSLQQQQNNKGDASSSLSGGRLLPPPRSRRPWTSAGLLSNNMKHDEVTETIPPSRKSFQSAISLHGARLSLEEKSRPSSPVDSVGTATGALGTTGMASKRASLSSSVSSFVSSTVDRDQSAGRTGLSVQRRMRAGKLPKMTSPPAGPPPSVPNPVLSLSAGDPNARSLSDHSPSRSSSVRSITNSDAVQSGSIATDRRLSESSSFSTGSRGTSGSRRNYNSLRNSLSQKRISIPPPPRPAPTSALPPTPVEAQGNSPQRRSSFRESLSHRTLRFSLNPQYSKAPRNETLRPRSVSSGPMSSAISLHAPSITIAPPAPPPTGPLPPTPRDPIAHRYSIRERLRMKSAPPVPPTGIRGASSPPTTLPGSPPLVTVESVASLKDSMSPVPIGEPITAIPKDLNFLNMSSPIDSSTSSTDDADFLNMSTPLTTTFPKQIPGKSSDYRLPEHPNGSPPTPEMTGLPPPPRRGRNGTISEKDRNPSSQSLASGSVPINSDTPLSDDNTTQHQQSAPVAAT